MIATPSKPRRVELILRQIDSLPTLPAIATRLLALTASDDSDAREVMRLIASDPPLTAKVLSLCRTADKGVRDETLTVDRAVVLLGFGAIRNAVLSVKVFEMFAGRDEEVTAFDRPGFWQHSLAVAILAESIVAELPRGGGVPALDAGEAFVCGLLHDIGKLALDFVLPKSFARVLELVDLNQGNIAEFERRIIGIDHHTAGKRLAEQWGLPHRLQDCIWLHGTPLDTLPKLEHTRLVGIVTLADLLARQQHVGYSGNHRVLGGADELISRLAIPRDVVDRALATLHEKLEEKGRALGLHDAPSTQHFLDAIGRANDALGRLNGALERRSRTSATQSRVLEAISAFHAGTTPGQRVQDVLDAVAASARHAFGQGLYVMLYPSERGMDDAPDAPGTPGSWLIAQYAPDGRPTHTQEIEAPPHVPDLRRLDTAQGSPGVTLDLMPILPWVADYLVDAADVRRVRLLPLACGWGAAALMLHDRADLPPWTVLQPLVSTWGAAIAAAAQHDGARRLGEELAQANSALADAQDRLLRQDSLARLGEMAAGAAHEMNNPLAVISGRSQLLAESLKGGTKEHKAAQLIVNESHRLSDLISCLRMYADPPRAKRQLVEIGQLLDDTVKAVMAEHMRDGAKGFSLQIKKPADRTVVAVDPEMIRRAVTELLLNAIQARPKSSVIVTAQVQDGGRVLGVSVTDDGDGMDAHTLEHAMDPFFSAKPAGRRVGMGLPRAQLLAAAHGGEVGLRSQHGKGTTATLTLPLDSAP